MFQALSRTARAPAARLLAPRGAPLAETVRGRKSRSDPKAKSKAGRIKHPPPVDPAEMLLLKKRFEEYNLIVRALRLEFKEEVLRRRYEQEVGSLAEERQKQEAEEHRALMAWNDQENERLRKIREQRVKKEQEEAERCRKEAEILQQQELANFITEKEREIEHLQEESKNFITLENLDQKIEEVLDNPKNYNFAIDREGRVAKRTILQ
ncbi:small ribosomal subunit protein mS26 [Denticeps clupeoides]|uniref:Small ribosomal subunit protein mS26 n=1 Tax=Denticeps clupeoides TaxID=299321 RepID=A0AAY4EUT4_9TELE|nr:28S ribosomal protein S26, mitochondrial [Denticeps clupeoides]